MANEAAATVHRPDGEKAACEFDAKSALDPQLLSACIHCGLCLPACPTYVATSRELESPRGRIYLLSMLQKGEVAEPELPRLIEHIDSCLGCLGCQTACPSGVQYGKILDQARPLVASHRSPALRQMMRIGFSRLLPDYPKLRLFGKMLRLYQQTGLRVIAERIPFFKSLFGRLLEMQEFLPSVPEYKPLPRQSWKSGEKTGEVQLFAGCVMDVFYNDVNHACVRLLADQKNVVKVSEQTCCGALAFHAGEEDIARELAKQNIELLEKTKGDIVVTAAGCGAMLKEYGHMLHSEPQWAERAADFSARVKDITEKLAEGEFTSEPKPINAKVAYHAACHLAHAQGVRQAPQKLLNELVGAELIPLQDVEHCCGSAGIYNLLHTELSMEVLDNKMKHVNETGADIVVTTNPGCLLQLEKGIRDCHSPMHASHLITLLDEVYTKPD